MNDKYSTRIATFQFIDHPTRGMNNPDSRIRSLTTAPRRRLLYKSDIYAEEGGRSGVTCGGVAAVVDGACILRRAGIGG